MNRILDRARDSDDERQWEDLPDEKLVLHSRSSSSTRSSPFKGTTSATRTRRTTRQRAIFPSTSPRKHLSSDHRAPVRARRGRDFVAELLPQDLLGTPTQQRIGTPAFGDDSLIQPIVQEPKGPPMSYHSPRVDQPYQQSMDAFFPQRGPIAESPSWNPVGTPGPKISKVLASSLIHVVCYITEVLGIVVRVMKLPLSIALVVLVCAYALSAMSNAIASALAPICSTPVISLLCFTSKPRELPRHPNSDRTPRWADFPSLLNVESKTFESLLDEMTEGPGLALEIKKAEMATSDLTTLVRVSNLKSREILADSLSEFVKDARKVGRGLTRFSSKVGGTVDTIIAINDYALHEIEATNSRPSALSLRRLWRPSEASIRQVVTRTFTDAMNTLSANMRRLALEAEVSISDLNTLEEHLKSIHEIVSREDSSIVAAKDELVGGVLAQLWTILGGNRKELKGMNTHLALLKGVGGYRDRARAHVVAALHTLETMAEEMEELRERVAAPELVGDAIPVEVHMKSIRSGLERLKDRRIGAKHAEEQIRDRVLRSEGEVKDEVKITRV